MYILILNDGSIRSTEKLIDGDLDSVIEGYLNIIDLRGDKPLQYAWDDTKNQMDWIEIEPIEKF